MSGRLDVYIGPMFAGKTSLMLQRMECMRIQGERCIVIKHARDVRGSAEVNLTHGKLDFGLSFTYLANLREDALFEAYTAIGIDEIQFFDDTQTEDSAREIVEYLLKWVQQGKKIVCAGIDTDYLRRPFTIIRYLIANADKVKKLRAVCTHCHQKRAIFSARTKSDSAAYANPIGGDDKYMALCRDCYLRGGAQPSD